MKMNRLLIGAIAVAVSSVGLTRAAPAAVITQNVAFAAQTLLTSTGADASNTTPIVSSFAKFNTTLGTLTGVSFSYEYDFTYTVTYGANGGTSGGAANGPITVNGADATGGGNGGGSSGSPGTFASSPFAVVGTYAVPGPDFSTFQSTSGGTNTLTFVDGNNVFNSGSTGGFVSAAINLLGTSSATITYTYAATPEPTTLAAIAAPALVALARRRRRA